VRNELEECGGGPVARNGPGSGRQERADDPAPVGDRLVADGVDAAVHLAQAAVRAPAGDPVADDPGRQELLARHPAVLRCGNPAGDVE
jgi:hypothetical protein